MTLSQLLWNLFFAFLSAFSGVVLGILWARQKWARDRAQETQHLRALTVYVVGGPSRYGRLTVDWSRTS